MRLHLSIFLLLIWTLLAPSCRSGPVSHSPGPIPTGDTRPPQDLALAVTVMGEEGVRGVVLESSRFVIEPDGVLRAATGEGVRPGVYPPRTRRLTTAQVNDLYAQVVRSGLDRGVGGQPARRGTAPETGAWVLIEVTAHERRQSTLYLPEESEQAVEFVRSLRRLARMDG